jgi:hypothetical protein
LPHEGGKFPSYDSRAPDTKKGGADGPLPVQTAAEDYCFLMA